MSDPFFFGYGSLVNRSTHDYEEAYPARVQGWRRVWRHTHLRDIAFLTVEPAPGVEIDGLIAGVPQGDWAALDARETGYDRHMLKGGIAHGAPRTVSVQLYAVPLERAAGGATRHPVLMSYLDVVVQGYLREFGEAGARAFFETTAGWDLSVLDDRDAPQYPRHRTLAASERGFVDDALADLGARVQRG